MPFPYKVTLFAMANYYRDGFVQFWMLPKPYSVGIDGTYIRR